MMIRGCSPWLVVATALVLSGCSSSWRAPVESRGAQPPSSRSAYAGSYSAASSQRVRRQASPSAYRVRSGDTLFGIAWQNGMDYREVARWNGIRAPYRIYAGQTLRLRPPPAVRQPPPSASAAEAKRPPPPPRSQAPAQRPTPPVVATRDLAWRWPANGRVSSTFKPADPLRKGIKIAGGEGSAIVAAERGKVVYSGSGLIGYGRLIIVKHNDNYLSAYGHNRELLVNEGDQVTKGQKIAAMGRANNGQPLLHFEIRRDGKPVDPLRLLPKR